MLWGIAAVTAFFIKGLCGFANTLVFTSILGFTAANVNISPVELILGYPTNLIQTWKNRESLKPEVCVPLILLVLAGSIPGALLLKNADTRSLKVIFGITVIFIGMEMLGTEYGFVRKRQSKGSLAVLGLLSGILCGLFGAGALLAAYVGRTTDTADAFKANLGAVFAAENTVRIGMYCMLGIITEAALKQALILVPFMAAGMYAGMKSAAVLDEKLVKKIAILFLILSGASLILLNVQ